MSALAGHTTGFLRLIRFEHTLFALPYAVAGAFLASRGWPSPRVLGWVLVAMVAARTAAMAFNRLADRRLDALNPRTASRASATGEIGPAYLAAATLLAAAVFVLAASRLNALALWLSFPTLAVLLGYSLTKRFWHGSHFVLGLALGLSPLGAWVAVRGTLDASCWPAVALGAAVLFWTAGFDILYACQDVDADRRTGLHSVPARFGLRGAFRIARSSHALVPAALLAAGVTAGLGWPFFVTVALVALLLVYEHRLVRADDLRRLDRAFFTVNVAIGLLVMAGTLVDLLRPGGVGG